MLPYVLIVAAFCLGMLPFGLFIAKLVKGIDPREAGSKNVGATNVARLCGAPWGVLTLALDLLKGFAPAAFAPADTGWVLLSLIGLAAILGHAYSPILHGKGGKAVATTVGVFLALAPVALILAAICTVAVIWLSGYVSMGSLTLALALPAFCLLTFNFDMLPLSIAVMLFLFWRHRENILRLDKGEEMPWLKGKKKAEEGA